MLDTLTQKPSIDFRVGKDNRGNDISTIHLEDGRYYRMVHFSEPQEMIQKWIICRSKELLVRVDIRRSEEGHQILIGNTRIRWVKGRIKQTSLDPRIPAFLFAWKAEKSLESIVLDYLKLVNCLDLWDVKKALTL